VELERRALMLLGDPAYQGEVRGIPILLPASHKLPIYVGQHPLYDTLPRRVAAFVRRTLGPLVMIDVGANVGDTILLCGEAEGDAFLGVEAHAPYVAYLRHNTRSLRSCVVVEALCAATSVPEVAIQAYAHDGTARVVSSAEGTRLRQVSLDDLLAELTFPAPNFLKVDTDGSDLEVLRGARGLLVRRRPLVLFECDGKDATYADSLTGIMASFAAAGYVSALVYGNLGELRLQVGLQDLEPLLRLLRSLAGQDKAYLDLLVLAPAHLGLAEEEAGFFASSGG
jgi:FkbM family methyltransferase